MQLKQITVLVLVSALVVPVAGVGTGTGAAVRTGPSSPASPLVQSEACSFPFAATDATGTRVTLDAEPKRVVTLQPSAAQTMWEIGAKEKVVGMPVGPLTAYLNGSQDRTDVTNNEGRTNIERVVSLNPDLVLAPNVVSNKTIQKLRAAGLTVYKFDRGRSIEDIYAKTEQTGKLVGACQGANDRVAAMKETVSSIRSAVKGRENPRVLYLMGGGYTAGKGTFINEVIETAGGDNIAANANIAGYKKISDEAVIKRNPEWIIVSSGAPTIPNRTAYTETTALKNNQTIVVNSNYITQPAPRVVIPMKKLAKSFHPTAFEQATETQTTETATTQTETGTTDGTATPGPTDQTTTRKTDTSGPGFGILVGIGAVVLVAAALLIRRV